MPHRAARLFLALLLLLPVCGCGSGGGARAPDASDFLATDRTVPGRTIYPVLDSTAPSAMRLLDESGGIITERKLPTADFSGSAYRLERWAETPGSGTTAEPLSVQTIAPGPGGEVLLLGTTNSERGVELRFDPPLGIAPAILRQAEPFESQTAAEEIDPRTNAVVRTGSAVYRLELVGADESSGSTRVLLRSRLEIRLGRSVVTRTADRVYRFKNESGLALERETATQIVSVMGFVVSRDERTLRATDD